MGLDLLFTVIALAIALMGFALLAWLQLKEREPPAHAQHPHAGKHRARRN